MEGGQKGAGGARAARRPEPAVTEAGDQAYVGQGFHVLDQGRRLPDASLVRAGRPVGGRGRAGFDQVDDRARLARDVAGGPDDEADAGSFRHRALGQCGGHHRRGRAEVLGDDDKDAVGAQHVRGQERAVQDQVRSGAEKEAVLMAQRLTFGAIRYHHRRPARALGHGPPLGPDRISRATPATQAAALQ